MKSKTPQSTPTLNVLVVDDRTDSALGYVAALERVAQVRVVPTLHDAQQTIVADPPDAVLLDMKLRHENGMNLIGFLRRFPEIARIVVSDSLSAISDADRRQLDAVLQKPMLDASTLVSTVTGAIARARDRNN